MKTTLIATSFVATLALAVPVTTAGAAQAGGGDVRRSGSCSGSADWKIKAKPDDGRIEVEAEIDSNVNGQAWHWVLRHDGNRVDRGTRSTHAPSGSFSVSRRVDNHAGVDHLTFRAVHAGQTCVARVSL